MSGSKRNLAAVSLLFFASLPAHALPSSNPVVFPSRKYSGATEKYISQLDRLRGQVARLEQGLLETSRQRDHAKLNLKKLQTLIELRKEERHIGLQRMGELENTVKELELRRESLNEKMSAQRHSLRRFLVAIESAARSKSQDAGTEFASGRESPELIEAPRRKLLANLASRGLKELETLKADLSDADQLEAKIQDEKQQIAYLFQDLDEKESVLELNRQMQADYLKKNHEDAFAQLENYRRLKDSQQQVERLIQDFNARKELEKLQENERLQNIVVARGEFEKAKGRLPFPVGGAKIVASFGRAFDPKSRLFIFKKGVDLFAGASKMVKAIFPGKVAYAGELPDYGRVAIIDHGNHFYSLCAHLGALQRKTGDRLISGDAIGMTDESGIVYFEIRSRNVAVNPLQWISESINVN